MKNKAMRILSLAVAFIMCFGVMSLSVNAADEYVPLLEDITGNSFEGILKTSISGIGADNYYMVYDTYNTGANKDHYYYTSLDGADYDKRYLKPMPKLRSLAYGGKAGSEIGIGVLEYGTAEAYVFARDLAKSYEYDGVAVDKVYNKIYNEDKWIELHPNIYYDSYSGYFFCHGLEYTTEDTYEGLGLYYTDGVVSTATYITEETEHILTWKKVKGDYTSDNKITQHHARLNNGRSIIDGDENGNIVALLTGAGINLQNTSFGVGKTYDPKYYFSLIKTTEDGDVNAINGNTGTFMTGADITADGKIVLWFGYQNVSTSSVAVYDVATCWSSDINTATTVSSVINAENIAQQSVEDEDGNVYFLTKNSSGTIAGIYKIEPEKVKSDYTPVNVLGENNLTTLEGLTAKDIEFDDDGNMLILTATGLYTTTLSETDSGVSASTATLLQADINSYWIQGSEYGTDNAVRGYKIDAGMAVKGNADTHAEKFECVSEQNIFETPDDRYLSIKDNVAPGTYDVVIRLTATNQPSIFEEKSMSIEVKPFYKAALNNESKENEKDEFTLTESNATINVEFSSIDNFCVATQKTYDADIDNLCILAAVYDKDTQKIKNTVTTYKVHDITADGGTTLEIPVEGDAGDTVRLFVWRNITNLVPFVK